MGRPLLLDLDEVLPRLVRLFKHSVVEAVLDTPRQ